MANNRVAIRAALSALLSGNTNADTNVFINRGSPLWKTEFPAILVYTKEESATPESIQVRRYIRDLQLLIDVKVQATDASDDALDAVVSQVETIMADNSSISGTVLSSILSKTEISVNSDAEEDIGVATLTYECKYIS